MKVYKRLIMASAFVFFCFFVLIGKSNVIQASTKGTVTASTLNVRKGPSVSYSVVGKLKKNTTVTITKSVKDSRKTVWYKISAKQGSKTISGYVSSKYVKKTTVKSSSASSFVRRTGYVTATKLNVRKSYSLSAGIITTIKKKKVVNVLGVKTSNGYKWYKISYSINGKIITGYVVSSYIKLHTTTVSSKYYYLAKLRKDNIPLYLTANVYDKKRAVLKANQQVVIRGRITVNGVSYRKVTAIVNHKGMNGYVKTKYLVALPCKAEVTTDYSGYTTIGLKAKLIASTMTENTGTLAKGEAVKVKGSVIVEGIKWYRCTFIEAKKTVTGYIKEKYVKMPEDQIFENEIAKFPESYKKPLRELHEKYQDWHFKVVKTGSNWYTVIENEKIARRNTIQSNQPKGGAVSIYSAPFSYLSTDIGAYNWETDAYTLCDGSNWYTAKDSVIAYYMDPRNSLNERSIFQYESLAYDKRQKSDVVSRILSDSFMRGNYSVVDKVTEKTVSGSYTDAFMKAGTDSNVSPYFLAIRSRQEIGVAGSGSVTGNYQGYEGYYNYYNIGATDSSTGNAIANGLKWASSGSSYLRPWTNPLTSILGGAQYISSGYISKGQNTAYFQKFNVVYPPYYSHQYMTNVKAPYSEASTVYSNYSKMNILDNPVVFSIPVYENMPSHAVSLPKQEGNPNSYLKSITVKDGTEVLPLTPTFQYKTKSYTMIVDKSVSSVTVSAGTVSKYARVSGAGTYSLTPGTTRQISLVCTAGNGTKSTYTVKITRKN